MPPGCTRSRRSAVLLALGVLVGPALAVDDPAATGPLPVGVTTVSLADSSRGRTLETEVWYPARAAGRDAAVRRGRYPLVLMAHGNCGSRTNYEYLTVHLASRGFLVAAPDFPGFSRATCGTTTDLTPLSGDLSFLRRTLHDRHGPLATLARAVRGRPTGLVGHSLGGYAVVSAAINDATFTAVVGLAPFATGSMGQQLAALPRPPALLVMASPSDATVSFTAFVQPFFSALAPPAILVSVTAASHSGFSDVDSSITPDRLAAQQTIAARYATAFLTRYLTHNRPAGRWLRTADLPPIAVIAHTRH